MRNEANAVTEFDLRPDHAIGPDLHALAYARAVSNARARIDRHLFLNDNRADFCLGDKSIANFGFGPVPPHVASARDLVDVIFDSVSPGPTGLRNLALSMVRKSTERRFPG